MATKKRSPALTTVPNEIAARYPAGQEKRACEALARLGTVQTYPHQRMIVLERSASQTPAKVRSALDDLQAAGIIEFVTPVLLDRESNTRQVLTDEIVLRLKAVPLVLVELRRPPQLVFVFVARNHFHIDFLRLLEVATQHQHLH